VKEKKSLLYQALLNQHQDAALAVFMVMLDEDAYRPKLDEPFSSWTSIPTKLEFDHRGGFERVRSNFWKCEGAESKSSMTGIFLNFIAWLIIPSSRRGRTSATRKTLSAD
jgi:hypothetical protein